MARSKDREWAALVAAVSDPAQCEPIMFQGVVEREVRLGCIFSEASRASVTYLEASGGDSRRGSPERMR